MKPRKIIWGILKRTGAVKLLVAYLIVLFVSALIIVIREPGIEHYGTAVWYCFNVFSTIGLGDVVVTSHLSRLVTVVLSICSILIVAVIPGIIASYYMEITRIRNNESMVKFLEDLKHLPELSKEELAAISEKVKAFEKNRK